MKRVKKGGGGLLEMEIRVLQIAATASRQKVTYELLEKQKQPKEKKKKV